MTAVRSSNVWNLTHGSGFAMLGAASACEGGTPMPDAKLLSLARSLRARAQEVLAQPEIMENADAQQTMREIAASYERLARRLEKESGADK